jgi:hypothetical protein
MVAFMGVLAAADYFKGNEVVFLALRLAAPLLAFVFFLSQGCYPELKNYRPGWAGALWDTLFGLLVMAVWVAPYLIWPSLRPEASDSFHPGAAGGEWSAVLLGLRFTGFVVATPFIEELLVRSYLIRAVDVYPGDQDFREIPVGSFAWRSFWVTVAWFTLTHASWEWPVAFLAGVLYNLWLYRRKHIGSLIVAHAVTNASLFFLVVWAEERAAGNAFWNLWFFL